METNPNDYADYADDIDDRGIYEASTTCIPTIIKPSTVNESRLVYNEIYEYLINKNEPYIADYITDIFDGLIPIATDESTSFDAPSNEYVIDEMSERIVSLEMQIDQESTKLIEVKTNYDSLVHKIKKLQEYIASANLTPLAKLGKLERFVKILLD